MGKQILSPGVLKDIGDLSDLTTTAKESTVAAINELSSKINFIDTTTVIGDLDDIPLNAHGRITLSASIAPTGNQASFDFHCFGNSAYRGLTIINTYANTMFYNSRHNSSTWKGWEQIALNSKLTPTALTSGGGTGTALQHGSYVKFEKLVIFNCYFVLTNQATIASKIASGLPTPKAANMVFVGIKSSTGNETDVYGCRIDGDSIYPNKVPTDAIYIHVYGMYEES